MVAIAAATAGYELDEVGSAIAQGMLTLEAYRCLSCVSEQCGKVLAALQGRLDQGCGFAGLAENKEAAQSKVKIEMEAMRQSIQEIKKDVTPKIKAVAETAPFISELADEVGALERLLTSKRGALPYRPDCFLTETERAQKEKHLADIQGEVKTLCRWFNDKLVTLEYQGSLDDLRIGERCESMIRALAFAQDMDESERKSIQEAMKVREGLNDKLRAAIKAKSEAVSELLGIQRQMRDAATTYADKLANIEGYMVKQKEIARGMGHGSLRMKGYPPKNNHYAQQIYKNWMEGRWSLLPQTSHRDGSFEFTVDSNLTPAQHVAKDLLTKYVDETDALKQKHSQEMTKMETKASVLQETLPLLAKIEADDQAEIDKSKDAQEKSWSRFALSHPVEYSHIKLLYDVNNYVEKAAQWSGSSSRPFAYIKSLMRQMSGEDHPKVLLPLIGALTTELKDSQKSWPAFLGNVGEFNLKRMLRPMVSSVSDAGRLIVDIRVPEHQAVADEAPQEVD